MRNDIGILYVLANRDMSLAKVGMTRVGTPASRAAGYTRAHMIEWRTYWSAPTQRVRAVEAACHRELARHRFKHTTGTEVYHVLPEFARDVAMGHVVPSGAIPWRLRVSRKTMGRLARWAVAIGVGIWVAMHVPV
jgi:hypothetical protein